MVAKGHLHSPLALVVRLVRVQLGTGGVPDEVDPRRDAQASIPWHGQRIGDIDADGIKPKGLQGEGPADGEQGRVALHGRAVVQGHDVRAVRARPRGGAQRADPEADRGSVALERAQGRLGVARMVGRDESRPRLRDGDRHPEAGEDL